MWAARMVVLTTLCGVITACTTIDSARARQYELEGQILEVRSADREVLIKHGDIKGFMPAMTMPFKVREASLLDGRTAGDLVRASLTVENTEAWIIALEKTGSAPLAEPAKMPPAAFVETLEPGDAAPDARVLDHLGGNLSLSDWRGSAVAVTFMYVRCPLPQFCPLLDRRFAEVQRGIQADAALSQRARLLSLSFDPDADTAARLKVHAERLHADPAIWRFATAPREVIDRLAAQFGVNVIREEDGTITHNMRTTVIGPNGRVVTVRNGSDWTAADILQDMKRSLQQ